MKKEKFMQGLAEVREMVLDIANTDEVILFEEPVDIFKCTEEVWGLYGMSSKAETLHTFGGCYDDYCLDKDFSEEDIENLEDDFFEQLKERLGSAENYFIKNQSEC